MLNTLDEEIWNFEIATTESPELCDLTSKTILVLIKTDDEPLFKKTKKNIYISEFLNTMSERIDANAEVFYNEQKLFEGKSNNFGDLAADILAQKWSSSKELEQDLDFEKYELVVYFSSTQLPGSFSYKARMRKTPIWHFNLAKDDGSVSTFYGQKTFFVNPKQARRFVPILAENLCDAKFRQPEKCDDLEKVTFLIDTSGLQSTKKHGSRLKTISKFISSAWNRLDAPAVSVISFGNAQKGLSAKVISDQQFENEEQIVSEIGQKLKWFGGKATFGAILERLDFHENVILLSNGFFGDLGEVKGRKNVVAVGYDPAGAILKSSLEDLVQGDARRLFLSKNKEELEEVPAKLKQALCVSKQDLSVPEFSIREKALFEFASGYRARLNSFPLNLPGFGQWKAGKEEFFSYNRRSPELS